MRRRKQDPAEKRQVWKASHTPIVTNTTAGSAAMLQVGPGCGWDRTLIHRPDTTERFRFALELIADGGLTKEAIERVAKAALRREPAPARKVGVEKR